VYELELITFPIFLFRFLMRKMRLIKMRVLTSMVQRQFLR